MPASVCVCVWQRERECVLARVFPTPLSAFPSPPPPGEGGKASFQPASQRSLAIGIGDAARSLLLRTKKNEIKEDCSGLKAFMCVLLAVVGEVSGEAGQAPATQSLHDDSQILSWPMPPLCVPGCHAVACVEDGHPPSLLAFSRMSL